MTSLLRLASATTSRRK